MNDVPYIAHESAQARQERTIKRLWILCIIMFAAFVISNGLWVYYENQFTETSVEIEADQQADNSGNNYIVNGDYGETTR
jgi:hypothetical protein